MDIDTDMESQSQSQAKEGNSEAIPQHYELVEDCSGFADIHKAYEHYCALNRKEQFKVSKTAFGRYLRELGLDYAPNSTSHVRYYDHVRIAESAEGNPPEIMEIINSLFRICLQKNVQ